MSAAEQLSEPLIIEANPFVPGAGSQRIGRPLQTAFGEVIRQIGLQTPVVLVTGSAGTGKTLLIDMTVRVCSEMGLSVRRVERGDLVHMPLGRRSDLLLVDEAELVADSTLEALSPEVGKSPATTTVFLCLPSSVSRFSFPGVHAVVVELTPLSESDARSYLLERATSAGWPDLFAPESLDLVVYGSRGLPRLLRSIASLAFFGAASEGASQISLKHVAYALASQVTSDAHKGDEATTPSTPRGEITVETPTKGQSPTPASNRPPLKLVRAEAEKQFKVGWRRLTFGWMTRLAGIAVAFAASFAVASLIPLLLVSGNPDAAKSLTSRPAPAQALPKQFGFVPATPPPAISSNKTDNRAKAAKEAADRIRAGKEPATGADEARAVARGVRAMEEASNQAAPAQNADQAKAATDVADQTAGLNAAVDQTSAVPSTADQAIATKEAAEQPTALQETANQPSAVTNTADQAIAEKQAADPPAASQQAASQPAPVINTVDQATATKQAANQAVTLNQVTSQARAAREAADRAIAAKEVAEREALAATRKANGERSRSFFKSMLGLTAPF